MRTRTDNRHPASQHIDKLRQFVQRGAAQKVPHFGDARIVLRRLSHHFVVLHHFHGTELPHFDRLAIHAIASLAENNRPWRTEFHRQRNTAQHRGDQQQNKRRQHNVFRTFEQAVNPGKRRVVKRHHRNAVHLFET